MISHTRYQWERVIIKFNIFFSFLFFSMNIVSSISECDDDVKFTLCTLKTLPASCCQAPTHVIAHPANVMGERVPPEAERAMSDLGSLRKQAVHEAPVAVACYPKANSYPTFALANNTSLSSNTRIPLTGLASTTTAVQVPFNPLDTLGELRSQHLHCCVSDLPSSLAAIRHSTHLQTLQRSTHCSYTSELDSTPR